VNKSRTKFPIAIRLSVEIFWLLGAVRRSADALLSPPRGLSLRFQVKRHPAVSMPFMARSNPRDRVGNLRDEVRGFLDAREQERTAAARLAALRCICGLDFAALLKADAATQAVAINRIDRLAERERMKGLAGHWSYDLNRHIALKQAVEQLRSMTENRPERTKDSKRPATNSKRRPKAPSRIEHRIGRIRQS